MPRVATVFSAVPDFCEPVIVVTVEQVLGAEGMEVSPMTNIGTELATSLPSLVPPVADGVEFEYTFGKLMEESSDAGILNPVEPVSTATSSMVTQFEVPGAQTWTVVNATLA